MKGRGESTRQPEKNTKRDEQLTPPQAAAMGRRRKVDQVPAGETTPSRQSGCRAQAGSQALERTKHRWSISVVTQ